MSAANSAVRKRKRNFVAVGIAFGAVVVAAAIVLMVLFIPRGGSKPVPTSTGGPPPTEAPYHDQYPRIELLTAYELKDAEFANATGCTPSTEQFGRMASSTLQDRVMLQWGKTDGDEKKNPCGGFPFFTSIENNGHYKVDSNLFEMYRITKNPDTGDYTNVFSNLKDQGKIKELFMEIAISLDGNTAVGSILDEKNNGYLTGYLRDVTGGWSYYPNAYYPGVTGVTPNGSRLGEHIVCSDEHTFVTTQETADTKATRGVYAADVIRPSSNNDPCFEQTKLSGFPITHQSDAGYARSVALDATQKTLVVGGEEAAYVYSYNNDEVTLRYTCPRPDNVNPVQFATSTEVDGDRVVVSGNGCAAVYDSGKLVQVVRPQAMHGLSLGVSNVHCQMTPNTLVMGLTSSANPGYTGEGVVVAYRVSKDTGLYLEKGINDPQVLSGNATFGATMTAHEDLQGALSLNAQTINSMTRLNFVP